MNMKLLNIGGLQIELEKKRIKNMYLRILPPEGRICVSSPYGMREEDIITFILSKLEWIEMRKKELTLRQIKQVMEFKNGDEIYVWGSKLYLIVREDCKRNFVDVSGDKIILFMKNKSTTIQREKLLNDWYRKILQHEIPDLFMKWENVIGVKSSGFSIRDMKTRWGTCNIRTKNICFNLQLAEKPARCLEYVVVHELVHLLERSHNHIFKGYMDTYLPQWRNIRKELNKM